MRRRKSINSLTVMVTYACDLDCSYCEVNKHPRSATAERIRDAVDLLMTSESPSVRLHFFGGEPLLRFDLVRAGIEYGEAAARRTGKTIRFMISTNGRLLDGPRLRWLACRPVEIMFSADGTARTHGVFRAAKDGRDVHGLIMENLRLLQESGIPHFVNVVVDPSNLDAALGDVDYLLARGVKRFQLNYRIVEEWPAERSRRVLDVFDVLARRFPRGSGQGGNVEFMNLGSEMEPTILADQVLFDVDGGIYLALMLLSEKRWPALRRAMRLGHADEGGGISRYLRDTRQIFELYQTVYPPSTPEGQALLNNIRLGLAVRRVMISHGLREMPRPERPAVPS